MTSLGSSPGAKISPWSRMSLPEDNRQSAHTTDSAGDELSFDEMFGERRESIEHSRSKSVISLDYIPEDDIVTSMERTPSLALRNRVRSMSISEEVEISKLGPSDFELLAVIGQGAFGKVFQVKKKDSGIIFAMKVMKKESILEKNHAEYVWSERNCLMSIDHPYIVKLYCAFQTKHKLYMILEFLTGGHLFYQLYQKGCFSEDQTRICAAELISAVGFFHSNGIIHRDLKPENILLDEEGHIKVTDFGLSKGYSESEDDRANSFVGTIQYMAPEVIMGKEQGPAVDWWSIGVLIYEMILGEPPFDYPSNKKEITEKDRKKLMNRITACKINKPRFCGDQAWSLIRSLLCRNPEERLINGENVHSHPFFKRINWDKIEKRAAASPFRPNSKTLTINVDKRYRSMPAVDSPGTTPDHPQLHQAFQGYSYTKPSSMRKSRDGLDCF